jgi:hypothetical protein
MSPTDQDGRKLRLPDRKHSADIIDRCAEYTEREAAANQGEQHDRFHAADLLRVDVKFVSEVGHGTLALRIGNARDSTFTHQTILRSALGAVTGVTLQRPVAPRSRDSFAHVGRDPRRGPVSTPSLRRSPFEFGFWRSRAAFANQINWSRCWRW